MNSSFITSSPSKHVKSGHSRSARKTPSEKRSGPRFGAGCCKLALYATCSSDIHVVKARACAFHLPGEIAKYADTCTTAQVDLSLSVGLWVAGTFKL